MNLEWNDRYRIGHAPIDQQHELVFLLASALLEAQDQDALRWCAMQLYRHAREHFADEEALMKEVRFPDRQEHADSHNRILQKLGTISQDIGENTVDPMVVQAFLEDWGLRHIQVEDARLTDFMRQ